MAKNKKNNSKTEPKELNTEKKPPTGRPPHFSTPEELQKLVNEYFDQYSGLTIVRDNNGEAVLDKQGKPIFEIKPPTISGLALHLGFVSRQTIYDYANRSDEFSYIIKRAKMKIVDFSEQMLYSGKPVGAIFALKNAKEGFEDAVKVTPPTPPPQFDVSKLTSDDLVQLSNMMKRINNVINQNEPVPVKK